MEYNTSDYLKSNEDITEYLNAALEENDPKLFFTALANVIKARGEILYTSKETRINQEIMYSMLSEKSNPEINYLFNIFNQLGIKLTCNTTQIM